MGRYGGRGNRAPWWPRRCRAERAAPLTAPSGTIGRIPPPRSSRSTPIRAITRAGEIGPRGFDDCSRDRSGGLHRLSRRAPARRAWRARDRRRQSERLLRRRAEAPPAGAAFDLSELPVRARRADRPRGACRGAEGRAGPLRHPSRGAGERALRAGEPARLYRLQRRRAPERARALPLRRRAGEPRLRLVKLRLWAQRRRALPRGRRHRPSDLDLRRDEEVAGADERGLCERSSRSRRSAFASSPPTGRGAGPTWPIGCSPRRSWAAGRSASSTTARCSATSPISTTSSAGVRRGATTIRPGAGGDSTASTISATAGRSR